MQTSFPICRICTAHFDDDVWAFQRGPAACRLPPAACRGWLGRGAVIRAACRLARLAATATRRARPTLGPPGVCPGPAANVARRGDRVARAARGRARLRCCRAAPEAAHTWPALRVLADRRGRSVSRRRRRLPWQAEVVASGARAGRWVCSARCDRTAPAVVRPTHGPHCTALRLRPVTARGTVTVAVPPAGRAALGTGSQPVLKAYRKCCVKCKMKCSHLKSTQKMFW
jgi:hypothetical protein